MDFTSDNTFISNPIKDIIISYLNPHELYIEELRNKTIRIEKDTSHYPTNDFGYGSLMIVEYYSIWFLGSTGFYNKKDIAIKKLNERANRLNHNFGIIKSNIYGKIHMRGGAVNQCYINY